MSDVEHVALALDKLRRIEAFGKCKEGFRDCDAAAVLAELERLRGVEREVNTPHTAEFLKAVRLEAAHQRQRWPAEHDAGKTDEDWIFLVGHLGGKASQCGKTAKAFDDPRVREFHLRQRLHHIITAAAALLNWHANATGADTRMRPGIAPPEHA